MEITQLDDNGYLFISPDIDDWNAVQAHDICAIIDMDGNLDLGVPGKEVVQLIRGKRQGALYNKAFAEYLEAMPAARPESVLELAQIPATNLLNAIAATGSAEPSEA